MKRTEFIIDLYKNDASVSDKVLDGLTSILKSWEDKDHAYYKDLAAFVSVLMEDYEGGEAKHYPGKSVKRRKDGVPAKKRKKRATKKGEYRDKGGKLKKC